MGKPIDLVVGYSEDIVYISTDPVKVDLELFSKKVAQWLSTETNITVINKLMEESQKKHHYVETKISYLYYEKADIKVVKIDIVIDKTIIVSEELPISFYSTDSWFTKLKELRKEALQKHIKIIDNYSMQPLPPYTFYSFPEDPKLIKYILESTEM